MCLKRDGGICQGCSQSFKSLGVRVPDVNHVDGNKKNNPRDGSNWNLMCHSCNVRDSWIRKRLSVVDTLAKDVPFTYKVSSKMELTWVRFMIDTIQKDNKISWDYALNAGALEIDGSQETVKRYLKKHLVDPDNPKSLFKSYMDGSYNTQIKFTDKVQEFFDKSR